MVSVSEFVPFVRAQFPSAPDFLLARAIVESAIEFCRRTRVVQGEGEVNAMEGEQEADVFMLYGESSEITKVYRKEDGSVLEQLSELDIRNARESTGTPRAYTLAGAGKVLLWPTPDTSETLWAAIVYVPSINATSLDQSLFSIYREAIVGGAQYRVGRNNFHFRNEDAAQVGMIEFDRGVTRAITQQAKGRTGRALRTKSSYM